MTPPKIPPRFIYVIGSAKGAQKIGLANNSKRRLAVLQNGNPIPLRLVLEMEVAPPLAFKAEAYARWLLRDSHTLGEWFKVRPQAAAEAVREAVAAVARNETAPCANHRKGGPGRPPLYPDRTLVRLPAGTLDRLRASCGEGELPADMIRAAVERELRRRELSRKPSTNPRLPKAARRQGGK